MNDGYTTMCDSLHGTLKKEILNEVDNKLIVKLNNGKIKQCSVAECISSMYEDMTILRDFNRVHKIFKKYKIYYILIIVIILAIGFHNHWSIKEILNIIL
ncbi:MAG: hypothetical protein FJ216_07425 [Ignavibacteria bacterium]|nr:hypothetical protein [Ignavibacteria bacterium]